MKTLKKEELFAIDFKNKEVSFYNVEMLRIAHNEIQVIITFGKFGNKGRENVTRFSGTSSYRKADDLFLKRVENKKLEGYYRLEKVVSLWDGFVRSEAKKKGYKPLNQKQKKGIPCDGCKKKIPDDLYKIIKKWARGKGNWDHDKEGDTYKKVLCFDCQIERGVYQKVLGGENEG